MGKDKGKDKGQSKVRGHYWDHDESWSEPTKLLWRALRGQAPGRILDVIAQSRKDGADFDATNSWGMSVLILGMESAYATAEDTHRLVRALVENGSSLCDEGGESAAIRFAGRYLDSGNMKNFLLSLQAEDLARKEARALDAGTPVPAAAKAGPRI